MEKVLTGVCQTTALQNNDSVFPSRFLNREGRGESNNITALVTKLFFTLKIILRTELHTLSDICLF